ncbi:MAG: hypothetical protein AAFV07_01540 [Bacteroidota bacterium]
MHTLLQKDAYRLIRSMLVEFRSSLQARLPKSDYAIPLHLEADLGLDSLDLVQTGTVLMHMFHLIDQGPPVYLPRKLYLDQWVAACTSPLNSRISFLSSGSQGKPQFHVHQWRDLMWEAAYWAQKWPHTQRIINWVPVHHIYGFMFGILLPRTLGIPVIDMAPGCLPDDIQAEDLVIGMPLGWNILKNSRYLYKTPWMGISSTAPLSLNCKQALLKSGIELHEIFGSTETAGLGWRGPNMPAYVLLPPWTQAEGQLIHPHLGEIACPDHLVWEDSIHFTPKGRVDRLVQIAGHNVSLQKVTSIIELHPHIQQCKVRINHQQIPSRLKALLVPTQDAPPLHILEQEIRYWFQTHLRPPERPDHLTFTASLPVSALGKVRDWAPIYP